MPMAKVTAQRRVLCFVYDGFEILDLSGPSSVFACASGIAREALYTVEAVSIGGGDVASAAGITVATRAVESITLRRSDTVLVVGAEARPTVAGMADRETQAWLHRAASSCERLGSVCSGAFLLANAGLLEGKSATTHWEGCDQLSDHFPGIRVESNALYVRDGRLWTSAGVTTGIDMALAMIADDHDGALASKTAKRLVVYAHRPGHQSQFSDVLSAQVSANGAFCELVDWLQENVGAQITVEDMADHAGMSVRSFYRKFSDAMGVSPSKFFEALRLEKAKLLLEARQPVKMVAAATGFTSDSGFRKTFSKRFGVSPSHHTAMTAGKTGGPSA